MPAHRMDRPPRRRPRLTPALAAAGAGVLLAAGLAAVVALTIHTAALLYLVYQMLELLTHGYYRH